MIPRTRSYLTLHFRYEEELARLQRQLDAAGGPSHSSHVSGSQHGGPSQPPPAIGHGQGTLFGGIMAGAGGQGGPGLAPPPQESQQPQGLPHGAPQGPPGLNPPPGPPQHPFGGYQAGPGGVNGRQIPPNPYADGRENPVRFISFGFSNGWQLLRVECASSCFPDVMRPFQVLCF